MNDTDKMSLKPVKWPSHLSSHQPSTLMTIKNYKFLESRKSDLELHLRKRLPPYRCQKFLVPLLTMMFFCWLWLTVLILTLDRVIGPSTFEKEACTDLDEHYFFKSGTPASIGVVDAESRDMDFFGCSIGRFNGFEMFCDTGIGALSSVFEKKRINSTIKGKEKSK